MSTCPAGSSMISICCAGWPRGRWPKCIWPSSDRCAAGGIQGLKSELAKDEKLRQTLSQRSARSRQPGARQYRADLRRGLRGQYPLHRPGIRTGAESTEWMNRRGPPEVALAVKIMRQVAAALQKAAEQRHRASGYQAREYHDRADRRGEGRRFRPGAGTNRTAQTTP